jgi:hypothetical protein
VKKRGSRARATVAVAVLTVCAFAEDVVEVQLLDNGDFAEQLDPAENKVKLVPWWKVSRGSDQVAQRGEYTWLGVAGEFTATQPFAAYLPLAGRTTITGRVEGHGAITITDGRGKSVRVEIDGRAAATEVGRTFEFTLDELAAAEGVTVFGDLEAFVEPMPRLSLELSAVEERQPAWWTDLEARITLPCPSEAELSAEILEQLRWIVAQWDERVIDPDSGFARHVHDIVTGERLFTRDGGLHPVIFILLDAIEIEPDPRWVELADHFLESWLAHCFHPDTGLPRSWDPLGGRDADIRPVESAMSLRLLLDLAEDGPEQWREVAMERALGIGEHILQHGVLPDGNVAPGYRPGSGEPFQQYPRLRCLDVPARLARLGSVTSDERYLAPAREAVVTFEYTWLWPGTWDAIDPGFDDCYGHYGARSLEMWQVWPDEAIFRNVALGGFATYAPLWRDALRLGGNVAADQVRCWQIFTEIAELEPHLRPLVAELVHDAIRVHFKGEQYENGAWGDVTIYAFDPKAGLQVGDLPGMPQNLLHGLALAYRDDLGLRNAETRGIFTAVMRSSAATYRRPYGYLAGRRERAGANPAGGSLRFAVGLVEMLHSLSR